MINTKRRATCRFAGETISLAHPIYCAVNRASKEQRIPVSLLLGYLAAGYTTDEIIAEFPDLKARQIRACLDYARELAEFEEVA